MKNRLKSAMITVEVLVALMILFLAVVTATTGTKLYISSQLQKHNYEDLYIATTSIMDKIEDKLCLRDMLIEGEYNNFKYSAKCILKNESKNYEKGFGLNDPEGLIGSYQLKLYQVELTLSKEKFIKKFTYNKMTQVRMF